MPYPEFFVAPMRQELTDLGIRELRTAADVDAAVTGTNGTLMIVVNSVCGCAAGKARPGIALALRNGVRPAVSATVFAGADVEATDRARRALLEPLAASASFGAALRALRAGMRGHLWKAGGARIDLGEVVAKYDRRARQEGFHVLHDWDGKADHVNDDIIPVDVLDYVIARRGAGPLDPAALAILLDYYFVHLLALFALRVWDEGDPDANLERVDALLHMLQGPDG